MPESFSQLSGSLGPAWERWRVHGWVPTWVCAAAIFNACHPAEHHKCNLLSGCPACPSVLAAAMVSAKPHWNSVRLPGAIRSLAVRWDCARCHLHFWSLQEVSGSRYTGKLCLAENLFPWGFAPSFPIWQAWFRLKHVGAQLDCKTPNPTTGFVSGSFIPPLVRPTIWLISKGPAVVRLPDVSAAEILLAGHLNIRQQKLDDQAELRNNESQLIRSSKVAFPSSSYLRSL